MIFRYDIYHIGETTTKGVALNDGTNKGAAWVEDDGKEKHVRTGAATMTEGKRKDTIVKKKCKEQRVEEKEEEKKNFFF